MQSGFSGQVNGYFRYRIAEDSEKRLSVALRMISNGDTVTRVSIPQIAVADVTMRRARKFLLSPGEAFSFRFKDMTGVLSADREGKPTVPGLEITAEEEYLVLEKQI